MQNNSIKLKNEVFSYNFRFLIVIFSLYFFIFNFSSFATNAAVQDEIADRQKQIEELERQIAEYQSQIEQTQFASKTLENEIKNLNAKINQMTLEIRSLELSIKQTGVEIDDTEVKISDANDKILKHRGALAQYLKAIYETDQKSLTEVLLNNANLSDFFTDLNNIRTNQDNLRASISNIRELKEDLELRQEELEDKRTDLERLRSLQAMEKRNLDINKSTKNKILKDTKGQEAKFQELVQRSKRDIEAIRSQITYLALNGVTAEEAVKFGQLAALRTGIRAAYLIAVLEVESGLGRNVGRCNRAEDPPEKHWEKIMHTRDHKPFLTVTSQLGLDPNTTAVSCPQYVNGKRYGWGGAMGPAQFIPSTWVSYATAVSNIIGRSANPWVIEDAFVAAAVKLARAGATAQTKAAEIAASKAYYSGNSRCSTSPCNSYANAIQRKAAEIEKNL